MNIHLLDEYFKMSIIDSIETEQFEGAIAMVRNGCLLNNNQGDLNSPLKTAIKHGCIELVNVMLSHGASISPLIPCNDNLLRCSLLFSYTDDIFFILVNHNDGEILQYYNDDDMSLFKIALTKNNINVIKWLFNRYGTEQYLAFNHVEAYVKNIEIAQLLLDNGFNLCTPDFECYNIVVLKFLITIYGRDIIDNISSECFASIAKSSKRYLDKQIHIDNMIELVKMGVNLSRVDSKGNTPLYYAVGTKSIELVTLMLDTGADRNIENKNGISPLKHAKNMGLKEIYHLMLNYHDPMDVKEPADYC